jgi:hypothetical protein
MRYQGTDTNIAVVQSPEKDFKKQFEAQYYREFGFIVEAGEIGTNRGEMCRCLLFLFVILFIYLTSQLLNRYLSLALANLRKCIK